MFYRETGQYKTTYAADRAIFPIRQDRIGLAILIALAFVAIPLLANEYWLRSVLTPVLVFSLAAIGLNILTGYTGQLSLGTAAFMAVGAFAAYNLEVRVPEIPFLVSFLFAGLAAAGVGILFGLPSLRIKGFYLAVATLAAQFFIEWLFTHVAWFTNYSSSGVITAPPMTMLGFSFESAESRYFVTLCIVVGMALMAKNMVRSELGRAWMAVRDMDVAAEAIGINLMRTKLTAFAVSSFYCGVAGALWAYVYLGTVEPQAFDVLRSFEILFMVIIGGLGSILGLLPRRGIYRPAPDLHRQCERGLRGRALRRDDRASRVRHFRRPDHPLPGRGTARSCAPVADHQGETQALAVPLLMQHFRRTQ